MNQTTQRKKPTWSLLLSFTGGFLILGGGVSMILVEVLVSSPGVPGYLRGILGTGYTMMEQMGFGSGFAYEAAVVSGVASGIAILCGALMVYERPFTRATTWGTVIIAFSFVSLIGIGGFGAGAVLGILGGASMFTWEESVHRNLRRRLRRNWRNPYPIGDAGASGKKNAS
jgi:hypothetical protein